MSKDILIHCGIAETRVAIVSNGRLERYWSEFGLADGNDEHEGASRVGDVVHAFLAADLHELSAQRRLACAERLLRASQLLELLEPSALIRASDQLRAWIDDTWPGATWHRELPVRAIVATPRGSRRIEGIIDLLLEVPAGVVLIDHKSYPGRRDTWRERAQEYAPQLAAYAQALRMAGRHVLSQWISFVVTGGAVPVNLPST